MEPEPIVAIIGAGGFIGGRLVEHLRSDGHYGVRPILRRAAQSGSGERIADAFDEEALAAALAGCTFVVHALAGDRNTILGTIEPAYRAAERAGCRRIIYLSSAVVHGQSPVEGTTEQSPLSHDQPVDYNLSKILAEESLLKLRAKGSVEIVLLRPGIVYGPRSAWTDGLAREIIAGRSYLVDGGYGLCNAIYVDNLIHAILLACEAENVDGEAFLLGEDERITWREFYRRVAEALGLNLDKISCVEFGKERQSICDLVSQSRLVPRLIRKRLLILSEAGRGPRPTLEMALLHRSRHLPSWHKARNLLGYQPPVSSHLAWRYTTAWLSACFQPQQAKAHD